MICVRILPEYVQGELAHTARTSGWPICHLVYDGHIFGWNTFAHATFIVFIFLRTLNKGGNMVVQFASSFASTVEFCYCHNVFIGFNSLARARHLL